jgi:hypothetical protein
MTLSVHDNTRANLKRWVALLLSPVAWTTCFMLLYAFDEAVCGLDVFRSVIGGRMTDAAAMMLFLTVITLGVTGIGVYLGRQIWHNGRQGSDTQAERDRFIGLSAMLLSGLFALLTVGLTAVIVVLEPC